MRRNKKNRDQMKLKNEKLKGSNVVEELKWGE